MFVQPGVVPALSTNALPRFNRSFEYDSLGERYALFLIEELLPEVRKNYHLSTNPSDCAIAGSSSGGGSDAIVRALDPTSASIQGGSRVVKRMA